MNFFVSLHEFIVGAETELLIRVLRQKTWRGESLGCAQGSEIHNLQIQIQIHIQIQIWIQIQIQKCPPNTWFSTGKLWDNAIDEQWCLFELATGGKCKESRIVSINANIVHHQLATFWASSLHGGQVIYNLVAYSINSDCLPYSFTMAPFPGNIRTKVLSHSNLSILFWT